MLWPMMPRLAQRTQLFAILATRQPDVLVHRWHAYQSDVPSLRTEDIEKINQAADAIANSLASAFPVRAVLIQGHADFDLRRSGQDREDFERKISRARAAHVLERLQAGLALRRPLLGQEQQALMDLIFFKTEGLGSHKRVNTHPKNEFEMSLNRRAEIFIARGAAPVIPAAVILCPHGGLVTRGQFAQGLPSVDDVWEVVGCPNFIPGLRPSPCVRVEWVATNEGVIDAASVGLCLSADNIPQGTAIIAA